MNRQWQNSRPPAPAGQPVQRPAQPGQPAPQGAQGAIQQIGAGLLKDPAWVQALMQAMMMIAKQSQGAQGPQPPAPSGGGTLGG